ncbi:MAG: DinB family protein [Gemmatimonadota bacterium]
MTLLVPLFDHLQWADAEALRAVMSLPEESDERAQAVRLLAHLGAAAHVWLARLERRDPVYPIWPELSLAEAIQLTAESTAGLRALASGDDEALSMIIEYRNSAGQPFRNSVGDILTHVALHGVHHRGQIALLARQGGGTPVYTDYILFARAAQTV